MPKLIIKDRKGTEHHIEGDYENTIMEILRDKGFEIEASCGGCCACATCHIYVGERWLDKLSKIDEDEESMLDQAFDVRKNSRLGCQIEFNEEIDGIEIEIAPE